MILNWNGSICLWTLSLSLLRTQKQTPTHTQASPLLLPPSQSDHDNPLHPGNMSSLIRLVSAALEKPCGEGPGRQASVSGSRADQARPGQRSGVKTPGHNLTSIHSGRHWEEAEDEAECKPHTHPKRIQTLQLHYTVIWHELLCECWSLIITEHLS